jgi:ABC-type phosphonate transport system ATPase subunit
MQVDELLSCVQSLAVGREQGEIIAASQRRQQRIEVAAGDRSEVRFECRTEWRSETDPAHDGLKSRVATQVVQLGVDLHIHEPDVLHG